MNEVSLTIQDAVRASIYNRGVLDFVEKVSCYQCIRVLLREEVTEYTDFGSTALCPHCGIDSIVPGEQTQEGSISNE